MTSYESTSLCQQLCNVHTRVRIRELNIQGQAEDFLDDKAEIYLGSIGKDAEKKLAVGFRAQPQNVFQSASLILKLSIDKERILISSEGRVDPIYKTRDLLIWRCFWTVILTAMNRKKSTAATSLIDFQLSHDIPEERDLRQDRMGSAP